MAEVDLDASAFITALRGTLERLTSNAGAEVERVAEQAAQLAAAGAPVDEGELKGEIRVEGPSRDAAGVYAEIVAPGHWRFNEFGTSRQRARPFLRPSIRRAGASLGRGLTVGIRRR